jgi:DNA-cytosine methyltransferase
LLGSCNALQSEDVLPSPSRPLSTSRPIIRVGSDCSGLESIVHALATLGLEYRHVFSCGTLGLSKDAIDWNWGDQSFKWYDDLLKRPAAKTPSVHVYHAGFPCQPYSQAGLHGGMADARGGQVLEKVLEVVKVKLFPMVLLENVLGLIQSHREVLDYIVKTLRSLGYAVYVWQLNAKDNGVPQNRDRVFILAVLRAMLREELRMPRPLETPSLSSFLDPKTNLEKNVTMINMKNVHEGDRVRAVLQNSLNEIQDSGMALHKTCFCINIDGAAGTMMFEISPCITRSRGSTGHWLSARLH